MRESPYKSYDKLPLFLDAETMAKVLGIFPFSGYELITPPSSQSSELAIGWWYPKRSSSNG